MVLDAKRAFLHADALTETYVKPPHLRDNGTMLVAEEMHVWRTSCSSRMATPRSESWYRHRPCLAQAICPCAFGHSTRDLDMVVHGRLIVTETE